MKRKKAQYKKDWFSYWNSQRISIFNTMMVLIKKVYNMEEYCKHRDGNSKNQKESLEINRKKTG